LGMTMIGFLFIAFIVSLSQATYTGNYALNFDGKNDYVSVPVTYQDYTLGDFWTLEAWIYPTNTQTAHQLNVVGYPGRHPNMNYCGTSNFQCPAGAPLVQLRASDGTWFPIVGNVSLVTPNQWHHIAGTWNNVTLSLYLDGVLDVSVNPYALGYTEASPCYDRDCDLGFQIGGNYFKYPGGVFSSQYFTGWIDEVRVWNAARIQSDIKSTMSVTLTGYEPNLLYYWRFDDYGHSITRSDSSFHIFGILGGGYPDAMPTFIPSSAPITATPGTIPNYPNNPSETNTVVVERDNSGAVVAGALVGIFTLLIGIALGLFVGWKYGKQLVGHFFKGAHDTEAVPLRGKDKTYE